MKCGFTGRCLLLTICLLQMLSTAERQLFDFLGRMWLPILFNFFNLIFVIFGFFGACQYKAKYVLVYLIWGFVWIAWNAFVMCFYLNVGILDNKSDWLNFGTGSASWWEVNGMGCMPVYPTNLTEVDVLRPLRPDRVDQCLIDYHNVEVIHAGLQCLLAVPGIIVAIYLIKAFTARDENSRQSAPQIMLDHRYNCLTCHAGCRRPLLTEVCLTHGQSTNCLPQRSRPVSTISIGGHCCCCCCRHHQCYSQPQGISPWASSDIMSPCK